MAKYCGQCGSKVDESDVFCGNCGASLIRGNAEKVKKTVYPSLEKHKWTKWIIILLIVLITVCGIISIISVNRNSGYKGTINRILQSIEKADTEAFLNETCSLFIGNYRYFRLDRRSFNNYCEKSIDRYLKMLEEEVGDNPQLTYKLTDVKELSDEELQSTIDKFEYLAAESYYANAEKAVSMNVSLSVKGKKGHYEEAIHNMILIKEADSGWKLLTFENWQFMIEYKSAGINMFSVEKNEEDESMNQSETNATKEMLFTSQDETDSEELLDGTDKADREDLLL